MKNKLIGIIVCMLLICTILPVSGNVEVESTLTLVLSGNTLYVGGSGPGNYTRIQDAVNDSEDGDTVYVYDDSSPYYERVQINTSISLIGEDKNTTVIDAYGEGFAIFIRSDNVSIQGFTIQKSSGLNYAGIGIDFFFGFCTISENIIIDNENGVRMIFSGNNNIIENNTFFNNKWRTIDGSKTSNNMILSNTIDHPLGTHPQNGISFSEGTGNNISGNTIKNCETGIELSYTGYNIVLNNVISSGDKYGIRIIKGSNNKIIGNNISYNGIMGIEIGEGNGNIIYHNNLVYNGQNAVDGGNNTWDDGEYGNYWSDYEDKYPDAKKIKKKGIWDTPYEIPSEPRGDNKDMCPLIKQWPDPEPKSVQNNENEWLHRLLDRFPTLQKILEALDMFYDFYEDMKGEILK